MGTLEERWAHAGFIRIHRSYLVSLAHVTEVRLSAEQGSVMLGTVELAVSRRHTRACANCWSAGPGRWTGTLESGIDVKEVDRSKRVVVTGPRTRAARARPASRRARPRRADHRRRGLPALADAYPTAPRADGLPRRAAGRGRPAAAVRLWPATRADRVLGLAVPWLALGVLAYPALVVGGWATYGRPSATRGEFAALVERRR